MQKSCEPLKKPGGGGSVVPPPGVFAMAAQPRESPAPGTHTCSRLGATGITSYLGGGGAGTGAATASEAGKDPWTSNWVAAQPVSSSALKNDIPDTCLSMAEPSYPISRARGHERLRPTGPASLTVPCGRATVAHVATRPLSGGDA